MMYCVISLFGGDCGFFIKFLVILKWNLYFFKVMFLILDEFCWVIKSENIFDNY